MYSKVEIVEKQRNAWRFAVVSPFVRHKIEIFTLQPFWRLTL